MKRLSKIFDDAIKAGAFAGAVLLVGDSKKVLFHEAYGNRADKPTEEINSKNTIYDIASMTKTTATTPAMMKLVEEGLVRMYDPVSMYIDGFKTAEKGDVRIYHLMTHTSGLPSYSEAWRYSRGRELLDAINAIRPINPVGKKFVYSCLNFITLMQIAEKAASERFDLFLKREIFDPMEMTHTSFNPPEGWADRIAPTSEREGKILRGRVDDELAYYIGGVSGNAGLFSNAEDLYKYGKTLLNMGKLGDKRIFSLATVETFTNEAYSDGEVRRGYGWDLKTISCSCGDLMSDRAYGHTGFTGTSMWMDPKRDIVVILLTNRVHVARWENQDLVIRLRPRVHNYILAHMEDLG